MAKKHTQGIYYFEDGYNCWVRGMSATEKRWAIREHGRIVKFIPTYY